MRAVVVGALRFTIAKMKHSCPLACLVCSNKKVCFNTNGHWFE